MISIHKIKVLFRVDVDDHNLCLIKDTYDRGDYEKMVRRIVYSLDAIRKCLIRGIIW